MIVILPCTVNLEFSFCELVAEIVAHSRHLTMEVGHRIAQHEGVEGIFASPGLSMKVYEHWTMFLPDQAERQFKGLTQRARENQNYGAFEATCRQSC